VPKRRSIKLSGACKEAALKKKLMASALWSANFLAGDPVPARVEASAASSRSGFGKPDSGLAWALL
jgi:hypothetical protein